LVDEIKKYSKFKSELLDKEHSLQKLLNSDGQKFRYHVNKKKEQSFPNQLFYDSAYLKGGMKKIENEFMDFDGWLDYYDTIVNDLISELNVF
jgi:uncharacterized protein YukJ